jgi:hypothetical protein
MEVGDACLLVKLNHARERVAMFLFQPERGGMLMMVNNC